MNRDEAIEKYEGALAAWCRAIEKVNQCREYATRARAEMDAIEAEVVVNGGLGGVAIDGKNAETRAAQLAMALAGDGSYNAARGQYRDWTAGQQDAEAVRDTAAEEMRFARAVLALLTAEANERAYAHGAPGEER